MLDQNTTTIITSIITVLGTLGGAVTGVFLSDRHASKMEERKLKQEKARRTTQITEEVYQILIRVDDLCDAFAYDVKQPVNVNIIERIKEIRKNLERAKTLIWLYLPKQIVIAFNGHMDCVQELWNTAGLFYSQKEERGHIKSNSDASEHLDEDLTKAQTAYRESLHRLQGKLEKLVE